VPLYEYYCKSCDGVFELLRPVRQATASQPCPQCDELSTRIVSSAWSAFVRRDGVPRRLPDDGSYWHLGKKVAKPITKVVDGYRHPEINPASRELTSPSIEEIERYEDRVGKKEAYYQERGGNVVNQEYEQQDRDFVRRLVKTRGSKKVEDEKHRLLQQQAAKQSKAVEERRRRAAAAKAARRSLKPKV
jgi:putative FmdB family regulatory protein